MILSGMSNMAQMMDNVKTFEERKLLSAEEEAVLLEAAEGLKDGVPCTACRYCCKSCPMGLDIPMFLEMYNSARITPALTIGMRIQGLPADKQPSACIACGACRKNCPQKIDIPGALADFSARLEKMPKWVDVCRERAAIQID
jgi:predicted aldo/keto reductase-like oxidoreductase